MAVDTLISVIIPAYQAESTIEKCIREVCGQSERMEVIVIDDGSKDRTGDICDALKAEYSILKVVHVPNGGVSKARNIGLERAEGRYISFVDADDEVEQGFFKRLVDEAEESSADLVIMKENAEYEGLLTGGSYIEKGLIHGDAHVWSKLYRREIIERKEPAALRFPEDMTIGEDMLFLLSYLIRIQDKETVKCISGTGYHYTENVSGAMLKEYKDSFLDEIRCWNRAKEMLEKANIAQSPKDKARLAVVQIMAALIVVSKFASSSDRNKSDRVLYEASKDKVLSLSDETVRKAIKIPGALGELSAGYKIKTGIFLLSKSLYIRLYGLWKKK